ncbi:YqaJ viral recombinase family protein [Brevibacterium aurantiacum]|nr:YqaJ viral recombinase family protein [Brevibacterium aurantiacum]
MTTKPDYRVPNARLILRADADHQDWLNTRTIGLGGSDVAVVAGGSRYVGTNPYTIWQSKTDPEPPVDEDRDIFWFGQESEDMLSRRFTADTSIATRQCGTYQEKANRWALANPDRLTADGGILEIKTTSNFTDNGKNYLAGIIPESHAVQLLWYMFVTGRHKGYIIALVDRKPIILELEYNVEWAQSLFEKSREFWQYVETNTPPPVELDTATAGELSDRYPQVVDPESAVEILDPDVEEAIGVLTEVKSIEADIKDRKADAEKKLKAAIGDKEFLTLDGRPVAKWSNVAGRRTFNQVAVLEKICADRGIEPSKKALDDIKQEFTTQGEPTRRFTLITEKAAA